MDFPIGDRLLRLADNSTARHPSCVLKAFWEYTEGTLNVRDRERLPS